MKYMIHICNKRRWYVNKFLIPQMLEQGIRKEDITVAVDSFNEGNLMSTMKMFDYIGRTQDWNDITWHLQDDVLLSSKFKARTDELYGDVICGFCSEYDGSKKFGAVSKDMLWYSFPCIGIKNFLAKECSEWFFTKAVYNGTFQHWINQKKHDDVFFHEFLDTLKHPIKCFNVRPNLVEHVDWLIGGSIVNPDRKEKQVRAYYWNEPDVLQQLQQALQENR